MGRFINPFTDWGFKRIFGQEINKDLLIQFLNDLLVGERHITDLRFMDKEQLPEAKDQRGAIYDIFCETDTKEQIIVEVQYRHQPYFLDRSIFYAFLIHNLLGLDVHLVQYPGHECTAVSFTDSSIHGDAYTYRGKTFVICDPTFIGSSIGQCMPTYVNVKPIVEQWY